MRKPTIENGPTSGTQISPCIGTVKLGPSMFFSTVSDHANLIYQKSMTMINLCKLEGLQCRKLRLL